MQPRRHVAMILIALLAPTVHAADPAAPAPDEKELPGETHTRAALDVQLKELRFDGAGLGEVIDFLRDVTGQNIYVDWPALSAEKVRRETPVTLNVKGMKLSDAIASMLKQAGATNAAAAPVGGVIVISNPDRTKAIAARFRRLAGKPNTREQRSRLDRLLPEVNFDATGLEDVIGFLTDVGGVRIAVDWEALKRADVARNTPITLRVRKLQLGQVLQLVLEAAGLNATLDFTIDDTGIGIGLEAGAV